MNIDERAVRAQASWGVHDFDSNPYGETLTLDTEAGVRRSDPVRPDAGLVCVLIRGERSEVRSGMTLSSEQLREADRRNWAVYIIRLEVCEEGLLAMDVNRLTSAERARLLNANHARVTPEFRARRSAQVLAALNAWSVDEDVLFF